MMEVVVVEAEKLLVFGRLKKEVRGEGRYLKEGGYRILPVDRFGLPGINTFGGRARGARCTCPYGGVFLFIYLKKHYVWRPLVGIKIEKNTTAT